MALAPVSGAGAGQTVDLEQSFLIIKCTFEVFIIGFTRSKRRIKAAMAIPDKVSGPEDSLATRNRGDSILPTKTK